MIESPHPFAARGRGKTILPSRSERKNIAQRARRLCVLAICLLTFPASGNETIAPTYDREQLSSLVPLVVQIVNLSALDPVFAASLVPDAWLQAIVDGAFEIEAETATRPPKLDAPLPWPVGPWATPASLVSTIRTAQPTAVAGLYRALQPRFVGHCRLRKASFKACDEAIRIAAARLSAPSVHARAGGRPATAVTPTQREVARLGESPTAALHDQILLLARKVWGEDWGTKAPRRRAEIGPGLDG